MSNIKKFTKEWWIDSFKNNGWWHLVLLFIFPFIIYFQSFNFDYTNFDDNGIIAQKFDVVKNIQNIDTAFKVDAFFNPIGDFYRPIQNVSFMLDAQVSGEKLWMFHITNLIIHILTCISLYYFLQFLRLKRFTAFLLSLLFAVHPLFASCVGWIPSRGDILIGLFGIQLFMTFGLYFKTGKNIYLNAHIILFLITIFTKETTVLFPFFFLYYYFLILKAGFTYKRIAPLFPFLVSWAACFFTFYILRKQVSSNTGATIDVLGIIPFLKNNPVIPTIVGKFFIPINLSTFPLYDNLSTIIGIVFLLVIIYLTFEKTIHKKLGALMGLLWFLLFAIPPTIYRLENADTFFNYLEHRTYLPMIGIIIILGFFLDQYIDSPKFSKPFFYAYIPLIIVFSIMAFIHCSDYKNNYSLTMRAAKLNNPSGFAMRASEYLKNGDTTNALVDINKAIQLSPHDPNMFYTRGTIFSKLQQHEAAEDDFSMALTLNPGLVNVYLARSVERRFLNKYEGAFRDIFFASKYDSLNPKVYFSFGNLFLATKNYPNADSCYSKAILLQPNFADAYNNRAYVKILLNDYSAAIKDANMALLNLKHAIPPVVYNNLGQAYAGLNQFDSAYKYFNRALVLNNRFADGYFERGKAKHKNNDLTGACTDWNMAVKFGYKDTLNYISKFCNSTSVK